MRFNIISRRTAIFWLASGGIFFFMEMEILGESAFADSGAIELTAPGLSELASPTTYAPRDILEVNQVAD